MTNTLSINSLPQPLKIISKAISSQERPSGLSHSRFAQDTMVNLVPKIIFARSKADLAENTFLELSESFLVYYLPILLGENLFRKLYSKNLTSPLKKQVSTEASKLIRKKTPNSKALLAVKGAISISCLLIPILEYSLNYFKNLFTLKLFKQGDFENIANLKKEKDNNINKKVQKSAKKHLLYALGTFLGSLGLSFLMIKKGATSKPLQNIAKFILTPGDVIFKNNIKKANFTNRYFGLDFANDNGKLALSKGQLTSCVLIGGMGYMGAAKDRGKQNLLETLYRYPLVGFYVITGSELFEKGFKYLLKKSGKCSNLIGKNLEIPSFDKLPTLAQKIAKQNNTKATTEFINLAKQKALIAGIPFLFSIGFMGMFVSGISNFFTKYRYNKEKTTNPKEKL